MEPVCTETDASQTETNVKNYRIPIFFGRQESKFSALRSKFPARNPLNQYVFPWNSPKIPAAPQGESAPSFFLGWSHMKTSPSPSLPEDKKQPKIRQSYDLNPEFS